MVMKIVDIPDSSHYVHRTRKEKTKCTNATNTPNIDGIYINQKLKNKKTQEKIRVYMKELKKINKSLDNEDNKQQKEKKIYKIIVLLRKIKHEKYNTNKIKTKEFQTLKNIETKIKLNYPELYDKFQKEIRKNEGVRQLRIYHD